MNLNDVKIAVEDLVGTGTASPYEGVHVVGTHGAERVDGLDAVDDEDVPGVAGIYVLDSSGNPAVSSRVVEELRKERDELYSIALWITSRVPSEYYKNYAYDLIDKATGTECERV